MQVNGHDSVSCVIFIFTLILYSLVRLVPIITLTSAALYLCCRACAWRFKNCQPKICFHFICGQVNFQDNSRAFSYQASFPAKVKGRTSIIFSVNEEVGALAKALVIFEV